MMNASWKICIVPITPMIRLNRMYGLSIGTVTFQNRRHALAPSMLAASYSCCGIDCNPASQMIMPAPALHRLIRISDGLDQFSLCNHNGGVKRWPIRCWSHSIGRVSNSQARELFRIPPLGLKIQTQSSDDATTGTIAGM